MFKTELTKAEKEVYKAICEKGVLSHKALAKYLNLSIATVKTHIANIYTKRLVHSIAELVFQYFTENKGV